MKNVFKQFNILRTYQQCAIFWEDFLLSISLVGAEKEERNDMKKSYHIIHIHQIGDREIILVLFIRHNANYIVAQFIKTHSLSQRPINV